MTSSLSALYANRKRRNADGVCGRHTLLLAGDRGGEVVGSLWVLGEVRVQGNGRQIDILCPMQGGSPAFRCRRAKAVVRKRRFPA